MTELVQTRLQLIQQMRKKLGSSEGIATELREYNNAEETLMQK